MNKQKQVGSSAQHKAYSVTGGQSNPHPCADLIPVVNRPPSANARGLAVGSVINTNAMGARGTALQPGGGIPDAINTRGAFNLNVHGTTGKCATLLIPGQPKLASATEQLVMWDSRSWKSASLAVTRIWVTKGEPLIRVCRIRPQVATPHVSHRL